ncbi:hypothetical protein [Corynebacterium yudongzhengii]|uniref:hypothetical protein n=1 Tax=Corynebacterium yudongzhengii TaxID=2080740 RepID=UPI001FA8E6DD|nr:hypothetical protein [Corynebacterium yudongzhengii]
MLVGAEPSEGGLPVGDGERGDVVVAGFSVLGDLGRQLGITRVLARGRDPVGAGPRGGGGDG